MAKARTCTELLTGGINSNAAATNHSPTGSAHQNPVGDQSNLFHKPARQWTASTLMDYFDSPLLGPSSSLRTHHSSGFLGQIHLGNSRPHAMSVFNNVSGDNHLELQQHFPFNVPEHLIPVGAATSQQPGRGDYNLNFTKSSGLAGYNRGTLQSNSPSLLPYHLQRYPTIEGTNLPFFMNSVAASAAVTPPMENHHLLQRLSGLGLKRGRSQRDSDEEGEKIINK